MLLVHKDVEGLELAGQAPPCDRISEKQGGGVLVVDEVRRRIGSGLVATCGHRHRVVGVVLHHLDAMPAEHLLLPGAGIGGHVNGDLKAETSAHDPDGQTKVSGGTDRYRVLGKQLTGFR